MSFALAWIGVIAFIVMMYVILDGFTLGVGLLFPWVTSSDNRNAMISTVLPLWDGNETWLVFAGAALYAGFPEAFATLLPAMYLPLMLLLVGLLLRGVSFEFMHKATTSLPIWERCFFTGSLCAVIAQGLIVGTYVQGFSIDPITGHIFTHAWFNSFSFFCAIALIIGYTLLGSARLIRKTSGSLQERLFRVSGKLQWWLLVVFLIVGFYSPAIRANLSQSIIWHNSPLMVIFIISAIFLMIIHAYAIKKRIENLPFVALILLFILAYIGFAINDFPYIVPYQLTFMQTKADDSALRLMLWGVAFLLPLLLFYTAYAYHIFGDKVDENKKVNY